MLELVEFPVSDCANYCEVPLTGDIQDEML